MNPKSILCVTLFILSIQASSSLFAIELFSFSSDDDGTEISLLTVSVHDEKKIRQDQAEIASLHEQSEKIDREIPKIEQQIDEADARLARKKQELRKKLREYQCSQK